MKQNNEPGRCQATVQIKMAFEDVPRRCLQRAGHGPLGRYCWQHAMAMERKHKRK